MAKYKAYPDYKDSGVEWLGGIPKHWSAIPLKFLCTSNDQVISESAEQDYEIEYVDIGSVNSSQGITKTETMLLSKAPSRARRLVKDGDVIISTVRTYLEAISPIINPPENMVVSTGFAVIRPSLGLNHYFAAYCLRASGFIKEVVARSVGVSYPAINASDLVNIPVPNMPLTEQLRIANFLKHETAKIDKLIEKQQQLIELLKEKRQAVISHAVTKGLNPNVRMKDSGIEWLGEVPEDWQLKQLRHLCSSKGGGTPSKNNPKFWIGDIPWVSPKDMKAQYIYDAEDHVSEEAVKLSSTKKIPIDSVLIVVRGMILAHSVPVSINKEIVTINQDMKALIPNENITSEYFYLVLTGFKRFLLELTDNSAHGTKCLRTDLLEKLWIPLPSIKQQEEIIRNVNELVAKLDSLVLRQEEAKKLLQERRTALISAAVTGKIDVRDWVAPDMQDAEEPQETTA
ncbi:TPA: restriction endonuclease subunit S [Serratia marcescens]|uniref:restriction endonuclease subunit S n=1 Tax=Serratia marcescens TaxID=615 RepID=UPI001495CED0|nr:restriction endonuclease subunit S [Serratia marcescens]EGT0502503.1 restriction endonuclease subunit S [Serratia marcescens]EHT9827577.1 restriction endonuclease subunit S [Serratia marcescens]EIU0969033.1 restriction endonuclease subunit S [Serratia marcescens]EMB7752066.1 restriction endonuclease subunit S [Serratia marcescens]MDP8628582.1 restriction endonuclease subunit S [Serratia marcescens]